VSTLNVRPIRLRDLTHVRDLDADFIPLDLPRGRLDSQITELLSVVPGIRRTRRSFVVADEHRVLGLMELRADPVNHRWIITRAALRTRLSGDETGEMAVRAMGELADHSARVAGSTGAKRVHVGLPEGCPALDGLEASGFEAYARETVYLGCSVEAKRSKLVRPQESSDAWLIHQLYHLLVPRPVQYAEALTSSFWDVPRRSPTRTHGFVVEDGLELIAYGRVWSGVGQHIVRVMTQPDALDVLEPLIQDIAARSGFSRSDRVLVFVPDYLQEYSTTLEGLGFQPVARQVRLVKYTAVPQRVRLKAAERAMVSVPERVPARTPTYLVWKNSDSDVIR
jgi:hypothetical protein